MPGCIRFTGVLWGLIVAGAVRADLHCEQPQADASTVRGGQPLAHRFRFVNRGPDPVVITDLRPTCGCLTPRLEQRRFQAGEAGTLLLEVNTLAQPEGPASWGVRLLYRAGEVEGELPLVLKARVQSEITVQPASLTLTTETALGHEITLIDRRRRPLTIMAVQTKAPQLHTRVGEARRDPAGYWVRPIALEVGADYPEGRHEEELHLFTSDPDYRELRVPLTVVKRSAQAVACTPAAVTLEGSGTAPLPARIVLLAASGDREVVVERVEADDPAISCTWAPGPGPRVTLKVRAERARIKAPSLQSAIRVFLRKPAVQTVTIPVSCTLR